MAHLPWKQLHKQHKWTNLIPPSKISWSPIQLGWKKAGQQSKGCTTAEQRSDRNMLSLCSLSRPVNQGPTSPTFSILPWNAFALVKRTPCAWVQQWKPGSVRKGFSIVCHVRSWGSTDYGGCHHHPPVFKERARGRERGGSGTGGGEERGAAL